MKNNAKIIAMAVDGEEVEIVAFPRGYTVFVRHILGETAKNVARVESTDGGSMKLTFMIPAIAVLEGLTPNRKTCKHLRFARYDKGKGIFCPEVKPWPRMRAALTHQGLEPIHIPGGFDWVQLYPGEIAIPDYSMSGSNGWIIEKKDVEMHLSKLPPLRDSGETQRFWVETVGWVNTSERNLRVWNHNPVEEEPLQYLDGPRGTKSSANRHIFCVEFDLGSKRVKRITENGEEEKEPIVFQLEPVLRWIEVGARIPRSLFNAP